MEICKTFSKSIAGNQMQKYSTCIILNVSFVFNSMRFLIRTIGSAKKDEPIKHFINHNRSQ